MKRRRIRERIQLQDKLNVFNAQTRKFIGYLVDVSDMGISLVGKQEITVNTFLKLSIELPEVIDGKKVIQFDGLSVWNKPIPPDLYLIGFQMLNISAEDIQALESLIEKFRLPPDD